MSPDLEDDDFYVVSKEDTKEQLDTARELVKMVEDYFKSLGV